MNGCPVESQEKNAPVDHVDTPLQAIIEFALASSTGEHLRLND